MCSKTHFLVYEYTLKKSFEIFTNANWNYTDINDNVQGLNDILKLLTTFHYLGW